ncbi:MAG: hypothetical protein LC623_07785, partial [Halobacteriales archaeon]|nr:hypothetical protein [Halobacteriales archaeon]
MRAFALTLAALLAGCVGEPAVPADPGPSPPIPAGGAAPSLNETLSFSWLAAAGAPAKPLDAEAGATPAEGFTVPAGLREMRLEAKWTCDSPTCALHLAAYAPGADAFGSTPVASVEGPSPLTLTIQAPAEGVWSVYMASSGPTAQVKGTV